MEMKLCMHIGFSDWMCNVLLLSLPTPAMTELPLKVGQVSPRKSCIVICSKTVIVSDILTADHL